VAFIQGQQGASNSSSTSSNASTANSSQQQQQQQQQQQANESHKQNNMNMEDSTPNLTHATRVSPATVSQMKISQPPYVYRERNKIKYVFERGEWEAEK
jgi:hypothetical protein